MLPNVGDVIYIKGNQAGVVIGYDVDATGAQTGALVVGEFARAVIVPGGDWGNGPSAEGVSAQFVPETGSPHAPAAPVAVTAGGLETAEPVEAVQPTDTTDAPANTDLGSGVVFSPPVDEGTQTTQLDALLAAGVIDQDVYDAAVAKAKAGA